MRDRNCTSLTVVLDVRTACDELELLRFSRDTATSTHFSIVLTSSPLVRRCQPQSREKDAWTSAGCEIAARRTDDEPWFARLSEVQVSS